MASEGTARTVFKKLQREETHFPKHSLLQSNHLPISLVLPSICSARGMPWMKKASLEIGLSFIFLLWHRGISCIALAFYFLHFINVQC